MIFDQHAVILSAAKNLRSSLCFLPLLVLMLVALLLPLHAQTPYRTPNAPLLGSAWYPEQWPESSWDADLTLMEQAHMNVVRIGEFAWSTLEPSEGTFELGWLDRAIALAAKHHIAVVMSTPTDAPPAWLTSKYPDTLGTNADGHLREHGNRRQFNYASPHYRQLCAKIVTKLAQRLGHNPNIIGWQIGNEYTDESFDPATRAQFQHFLKVRYKTLENLNTHWATAYWSQTYQEWSQIPMESASGNPGLLLEHKHFVTATWRSFQKVQVDVLRSLILPTQFITTNIGGLAWSDNWDHYAMTEDLDLATWDEYVGQGHLDASKEAMLNDFVRGWKRQNFWLMETQPGSVNWASINNALAPGETRALAWQAIGHGADAVLYWQWRAALNGQEEYHGTIAGPDGKPLPIYSEIAQLGHDLDLTRTALAGTEPHAEVALLHTYDSRWAIDFQPHTRLYDQQQVLLQFHAALQHAAGTVDIVDPTQHGELSQYKLLVAPSLNVIDEALAAKLLAYVQQGGHLLLGPRSGMKDQYDALNPQRQPGPLAAALGAKVEQYYALEHTLSLETHAGTGAEAGSASIWAEQITPTKPDAQVLITYEDPQGWLDAKPAMVGTDLGKGRIFYLGTIPNDRLLTQLLTRQAFKSNAFLFSNLGSIPKGVEVSFRSDAAGKTATRHVFIAVNHNSERTDVKLYGHLRNLLPDVSTKPDWLPTGQPATSFTLPPQGVAVLVPEPKQ